MMEDNKKREDRKKKDIVELTRCSVGEYREMEKIPLSLLADNVRSMHNIGSFFRTSDAFRVDEIILAGISGTPPHPEISKTALGAEDSVAWRHVEDAVEEVKRLSAGGWTILALEQAHHSVPLQRFEIEKDKKYLLVVGNEVNGVDQEIVSIADTVIEIPQEGTKHSLNVAASTAIALWHLYALMSIEPVGGHAR